MSVCQPQNFLKSMHVAPVGPSCFLSHRTFHRTETSVEGPEVHSVHSVDSEYTLPSHRKGSGSSQFPSSSPQCMHSALELIQSTEHPWWHVPGECLWVVSHPGSLQKMQRKGSIRRNCHAPWIQPGGVFFVEMPKPQLQTQMVPLRHLRQGLHCHQPVYPRKDFQETQSTERTRGADAVFCRRRSAPGPIRS